MNYLLLKDITPHKVIRKIMHACSAMLSNSQMVSQSKNEINDNDQSIKKVHSTGYIMPFNTVFSFVVRLLKSLRRFGSP